MHYPSKELRTTWDADRRQRIRTKMATLERPTRKQHKVAGEEAR